VNGEWYLVAERRTLYAVFHYNCRGSSTNQPFYAKQTQFKAKTKPIYRTTKMSVSSALTRVYERNSIFAARKTKPKQSQFAEVLKMNVSSALTRSYGDMATLTARQNKPNQSQFRYLLCSRPSPHLLIDCGFLKGALHVCRYGRALFDDAASASGNEERMHLKNPPAIMNLARRIDMTSFVLFCALICGINCPGVFGHHALVETCGCGVNRSRWSISGL